MWVALTAGALGWVVVLWARVGTAMLSGRERRAIESGERDPRDALSYTVAYAYSYTASATLSSQAAEDNSCTVREAGARGTVV